VNGLNHPVRVSCSSERLAVGLLFVFVATLACFAPAQSDTWWHLRAGQDIWRSRSINLADTYSYTARGALWPNHEWLTEVIFYAAYAAGGLALLTATCAGAVTLAWAMSWRLATGTFEVRLLVFAFAVAAATTHWALRPQVLSMALLAATVSLLVAGRHRWLPAMFVVWTNLHGAVALGIVAVGATLAARLIAKRTAPRSLVIATAGCVLATCVSPLGLSFWPEVARSIERSRVSNLVEWHPPPMTPALLGFWVIAAALVVLLVVKRRQLDDRSTTLSAISLALLPLAVTSFRNVSTFLLVAAPALSTLAGLGRANRERRGLPKENDRVNMTILLAAAAVAAAVVATAWRSPAPGLGWRPMSSQIAQAVAACEGPLYNSYDAGGPLIWLLPDRLVFVDNRQDPYSVEFLRDIHRLERDGDYQSLFERHDVRCALTETDSPVAIHLRSDARWSVRQADAKWVIFERD
jgi:hypothetical protein